MPRSNDRPFVDTDAGNAFRHAYDAVLGKWPSGTTVRDIESRFGTTRVTTCGPEGAPPVLLLPGGGATSTVWFANAPALATDRRLWAVDYIGDAGRSVASGDPMRTVDDLLEWLGVVVEATGSERPSLIGHSYGAMVAAAYALRAAVDKLVLLDPSSVFTGMKPSYLLRAIPILVRPSESRQLRFLGWETEGARLDPDWVTLAALGAAHFPSGRTIVPKRAAADALAGSDAEVTVVFAPHSKVHDSARVAEIVAHSVPAAHVVTLASGTHHCVPMEPVGELNAILRRALAGPETQVL